jgi:hypothetical protein
MAGRTDSWKRLVAWCVEKAVGPAEVLSCARWPRLYVAQKLKKGLTPSYLKGEIDHWIAGAQRLLPPTYTVGPAFYQGLKDAKDSLQRLFHLFPRKQAKPATRQCVDLLRHDGVRFGDNRGVRTSLMWHAMARHADLMRLWATDLVLLNKRAGLWRIRWRVQKQQQKGAVQMVEIRVPTHLTRSILGLQQRARQAGRKRIFLPSPCQSTFGRWIKKVCPGLSLHSFRRGAIQLALDKGVPPRAVMAVSLHKCLESLLTYADRICPRQRKRMLRVAEVLM